MSRFVAILSLGAFDSFWGIPQLEGLLLEITKTFGEKTYNATCRNLIDVDCFQYT